MPTPPLTPPNYKKPEKPTANPAPLKPWQPNIASEPETPTPGAAPAAEPEAEAAPPVNASIPTTLRGPKRKCPNCLYYPMKPLADFQDDDIEKAYMGEGEYYYQDRPFIHNIPFIGLLLGLAGFLGNRLSAKTKDAQHRAKAHRAKSEILERCPTALICPECCEVLELQNDPTLPLNTSN